MSRDRLYRAIKVLLDECLIVRVRSAVVGKETAQYQLISPMVAQTIREDRERKKSEGGEGLVLHIVSPVRHGSGVPA
jgi:hypothetical protein